MLHQEAPDGFIVEFQAQPGQQDASDDDGQGAGEGFREGEVSVFHPRIVQVDERVMDHVQGVGDSAQEPAYFIRIGISDFAGGAKEEDEGEEDGKAYGFIEAVHPEGVFSPQPGNGQQDGEGDAAQPEGALDVDGLEQPEQKQPGGEGVQQAQGAACPFRPGHGEAGADVSIGPPEAEGSEAASGQDNQYRQGAGGEFPDEQRIKEVADVFKEQGPAWPVERVHFSQAPDFKAGRRRNQQDIDEGGDEQGDDRHLGYIPYGTALEIKDKRADDRSYRHHGLQAYEAALDEFPGGHRLPAVVVGVADDEPGQHEEKVDGQVAVVDDLVHMAGGVGFKDVEPYDDDGGYPAQTVKNVVVMFFTSRRNERVLRVGHGREQALNSGFSSIGEGIFRTADSHHRAAAVRKRGFRVT